MLGATGQNILRVNLLDISPQNKAILEFFFAGAGSRLFRVTSKEDADAFIVDFDHPNARENWQNTNAELNKPTIAIAFYETDEDNTVWLAKPLTTQALTSAAQNIKQLLSENPEDRKGAADSNSLKDRPSKLPPINAAPNASLLKRRILQQKLSGSKPIPTKTATSVTTKKTPLKTQQLVTNLDSDEDKPTEKQTQTEAKTKETSTSEPAKRNKKFKRPPQPTEPEIPLEVREARWKKLCGDEADIQNPNAWKSEVKFFTPENYLIASLQDALRLATQSRQMVQIKHQSAIIFFIPETAQAYSNILTDSEEFEQLCNTPVKKADVQIGIMDAPNVEKAEKVLAENPKNVYDLEGFLWSSMLLTSAGKLHKNTDIRKRIILKHWPNLTRLECFPHVVRISALWSGEAFNMLEIAHNLDIPQRYVFSFYNASCVLGLMEHDPSKLTTRTQTKSENQNRGLFSRLLKRLIG